MSQARQSVPFAEWMQATQASAENALTQLLPTVDTLPQRLHEAMRYAALDGGKRVRPLLVHAAADLFQGEAHGGADTVARAAAAVEMIHAYSLVHDDMPCMDDDALRRGKPTVHVKYDQATALLVGDALQSQAFLVLSGMTIAPARAVAMIGLLAQAAGSTGMCGGQAIDLGSVGIDLSLAQLEQMHQLKTGALLRAAVLLGAWCGKTPSADEAAALNEYAGAIGLAFQVVDDVLDATADSTTLGKTAGKDAAANKPTYVSILGLDASRALAEKLCRDAQRSVVRFGDNARRLCDIAELIVQRKA